MNKENIEVKTLTNEDLKNLIVDVNRKQIGKISILSLYYSIFDTISLKKNMKEKNVLNLIENYDDKKILKYYYDTLVSYVEEIEKVYTTKDITKLLNIRKNLYEDYILFMSYNEELKYVEEMLNYQLFQEIAKEKYKKVYLSNVALNTFYMNLTDFLVNNIKNFEQFIYIIGTIVRLTPFRLTKEKFIGMVEENLKNNFNRVPKVVIHDEIERIKREFNGTLAKGYGIKFDDYFRKIESFKKLDIENLDIESLEKKTSIIKEIIIEMEFVINFLKSLGILTNKLIALNMSKDTIGQEHIDEGILVDWKKYSKTNNDEILNSIEENIKKCIDDEEKILFETLGFFEEINEEAFNRKNILKEDLNDELENTRKILAYFNDVLFQDDKVLLYDITDIPNKDYIEQLINNLSQYLSRNISNMTNIERKIRMKSLLTKLRVPFKTLDDFINYLKGCLDLRVTNKEEILSSIDSIYYFMNMYKEFQSEKDR